MTKMVKSESVLYDVKNNAGSWTTRNTRSLNEQLYFNRLHLKVLYTLSLRLVAECLIQIAASQTNPFTSLLSTSSVVLATTSPRIKFSY
jgi:hypothetical protein